MAEHIIKIMKNSQPLAGAKVLTNIDLAGTTDSNGIVKAPTSHNEPCIAMIKVKFDGGEAGFYGIECEPDKETVVSVG